MYTLYTYRYIPIHDISLLVKINAGSGSFCSAGIKIVGYPNMNPQPVFFFRHENKEEKRIVINYCATHILHTLHIATHYSYREELDFSQRQP